MDIQPTKCCARCRQTKTTDAFRRKGLARLHSYCKDCMREYQRGRPRIKSAKEMVKAAKQKACADCGIQYPVYVMDLDHRPGTKKLANFNVLVKAGASAKVLLAEIAKCDVVCANCHRERTYRRKQWQRVEQMDEDI